MYHIILFDRDFFFKFDEFQLFLYAHLIDIFIIIVVTKNDSNQIIKISRNLRLNIV